MNEARVIIVGGGAAGIAAATRLTQNGFKNVTILEAENRLGGRCNTVTLGGEDIDLGAQWIHGETHNVVHEMAASINLTKDSIVNFKNRFQFVLPNGKPLNSEVGKKLLKYCAETLRRITEQKPLTSEVCEENIDEALKDLNSSAPEIYQKKKLPSNLFLGEVYMKNASDMKDLEEFAMFNQDIRQKSSNRGLSVSEVRKNSFKENVEDLNETNSFNQEIGQKRKFRSGRGSICEVYTESSEENLEDLNDFNSFNQEAMHQLRRLRPGRASMCEVFKESFKENREDVIENQESIHQKKTCLFERTSTDENGTVSRKEMKDLDEFNTSNLESIHQEQKFRSKRALSLGEVFMKSFHENLKDLDEFNHSKQGSHQTSPNLTLSVGEVYMKRFHENQKDLNELRISNQELRLILDWFHKLKNTEEASDSWYDVSFEGLLKYKECEGNQYIAWKTGGYSNIIDLLLQIIPKNKPQLNVLYGKEVTQIITMDRKVVVKCLDGSIFTTDHIIVCVSLGVLKHNPRMFSPPLPSHKQTAIKTIALGVAEKLFIQFPHRWWPADIASLNILLDAQAKEELHRVGKKWLTGVAAFFVLDNAPNTLCGWVGGAAARYISTLSDDVLIEDLCYFLKRYYSDVYTIPKPTRFVRSNWYGNPHFRGAYSFVTVRANVSRSSSEDLAEPIVDKSKPVLMFAGEATHPHFFSTVHGAIETGWREADRLLAYYKQNVPLKLF